MVFEADKSYFRPLFKILTFTYASWKAVSGKTDGLPDNHRQNYTLGNIVIDYWFYVKYLNCLQLR